MQIIALCCHLGFKIPGRSIFLRVCLLRFFMGGRSSRGICYNKSSLAYPQCEETTCFCCSSCFCGIPTCCRSTVWIQQWQLFRMGSGTKHPDLSKKQWIWQWQLFRFSQTQHSFLRFFLWQWNELQRSWSSGLLQIHPLLIQLEISEAPQMRCFFMLTLLLLRHFPTTASNSPYD